MTQGCPNTLPGTDCVDPTCTYCKILRDEAPRRNVKLVQWPGKVHPGQGQHTYHWCPACERLHVIPDNRWTRTGPDESPTYSPSFLQYDACGKGQNCHYFIREGTLMYQADSWHGRTDIIPMPDVPERVLGRLTEEVFKQ